MTTLLVIGLSFIVGWGVIIVMGIFVWLVRQFELWLMGGGS